MLSNNNHKFLKYKFWAIVAIVGVIIVSTYKDYGITGDEFYSKYNAEVNYDFYSSYGKLKKFLPQDESKAIDYKNYTHNYPPLVDIIEYALIGNLFNDADKELVPHLINALIGLFLFVIVGLLAKELSDWRGGIFALVMIILTPKIYGEIFNNPKDIPFAAFYIFVVYNLVRWIKILPRFETKRTTLLWISLGLALGVRSITFILFFSVFLFAILYYRVHKHDFPKEVTLSKYFRKILKILVLGYALGVLFWPYALINPFKNALDSFITVSKFPIIIQTLYDGAKIGSDQVPATYLLNWIFISTPIIFTFGLGLYIYSLIKQKKILFLHWIVIFCVALPMLLIIGGKSNLYNTWRQAYFLYPGLVVLSALGLNYFMGTFNYKSYFVKYFIIILGFFFPLKYAISNHPFQSVYFNAFNGSKENIFGKYETDYYGNALKKGFDWLYENEIKGTKAKKVRLATNYTAYVLLDYVKHIDTNIAISYVRYPQRNDSKFDYYIINTQLINPTEYLNEKLFPPFQTLKIFYVNDIPICWILKKANNNNILANQALKNKDYASAYQNALDYFQSHNKEIENIFTLLESAQYLGKPKDTIDKYIQYVSNLAPNSQRLIIFKTQILLKEGKYREAKNLIETILNNKLRYPIAVYYYSIILNTLGNTSESQKYMEIYQKMAQ